MFIWKDYDPATGIGDPSTPTSAADFNAAFAEKADAAATTASLALKLDIASAGVDATVAVAALAAVTPTIEELICSVPVANYTGTSSSPILVAPFPLRIISASLIVWASNVVASDTNWWRFDVGKQAVGGVSTQIATKTTKVTGGFAITSRVDWNFDTVSWNTTEATFAKGDVLQFVGYITGTPGAVTQPLVTVRYQPL